MRPGSFAVLTRIHRRVCILVLLSSLLLIPTFPVIPGAVSGNDDFDPSFVGSIPNRTVALGRNVVIPCVVKNLKNFKVGWIKADSKTILSMGNKVVSDVSRIFVSNDDNRIWKLHIRQTKTEDKGCYMCQINTSKLKSQTGCLDVYVPPDIVTDKSSTDIVVKQYRNATLLCEAEGHPKPIIEWLREDLGPFYIYGKRFEKYKGPSLVFRNVTKRDMGAYLCIASNEVPPAVSKRIELKVKFLPIFEFSNIQKGAFISSSATLLCKGEGFPIPDVRWKRANSEIVAEQNKYRIRENVSNLFQISSELEVSNITDDDFGTYECRMNNSEGWSHMKFVLYEIVTTTATVANTALVTSVEETSETTAVEASNGTVEAEEPDAVSELPTTKVIKKLEMSRAVMDQRITTLLDVQNGNKFYWYHQQLITNRAGTLSAQTTYFLINLIYFLGS